MIQHISERWQRHFSMSGRQVNQRRSNMPNRTSTTRLGAQCRQTYCARERINPETCRGFTALWCSIPPQRDMVLQL